MGESMPEKGFKLVVHAVRSLGEEWGLNAKEMVKCIHTRLNRKKNQNSYIYLKCYKVHNYNIWKWNHMGKKPVCVGTSRKIKYHEANGMVDGPRAGGTNLEI